MKLDQSGESAPRSAMPSGASWYREDPNAWSSGEILRLLLTPMIAAVLLVGGVYWMRLQLPAGAAGSDQASIVQVHLLPRPDPAPIPLAAASQPAAANISSRTDVSVDQADTRVIESLAVASPTPTPAEAAEPSAQPTASPTNTAPSSATIKFRQALLRHVAQYQRYPAAARLGRLQGSVETLFSMRRDGTLVGVWVKTSSGQLVLDKEAVDTIRRAQPLPTIPPGLPDRLNVQVVLVFDPA